MKKLSFDQKVLKLADKMEGKNLRREWSSSRFALKHVFYMSTQELHDAFAIIGRAQAESQKLYDEDVAKAKKGETVKKIIASELIQESYDIAAKAVKDIKDAEKAKDKAVKDAKKAKIKAEKAVEAAELAKKEAKDKADEEEVAAELAEEEKKKAEEVAKKALENTEINDSSKKKKILVPELKEMYEKEFGKKPDSKLTGPLLRAALGL